MDGTINPTAAAAPTDWEEEAFHFHIINNTHNNTNSASSSACSSPHDLRKYNQPLIHVSNNNIDNHGSFNGSLSVESGPTLFHNVTFPSDPGFADRAARFSSFVHGGLGFPNFNNSPNLSAAPSPSPMFNPSSNPNPNPNPNPNASLSPNPNFPHRLYLSRSVPSSPTFNSNARRGQIAFGSNSGLNYNELLNPLLANTDKLAISHHSDLLSAILLNPLNCDSKRNTQGTAPNPDTGNAHSNLDHASSNEKNPDRDATFITNSVRPSISAVPPLTLNSTCKKRKSNSSTNGSPGVPVLSKQQLVSHNNISKPSKYCAADMNMDDLQLTSPRPRPRPGDTRALHGSSALIMPPEKISLTDEKVCQRPLKDEAAEERLVAGVGLEDDECQGAYATNSNSMTEANSASGTAPNSEVKIGTHHEEAPELEIHHEEEDLGVGVGVGVGVAEAASAADLPQPQPQPQPQPKAASQLCDPPKQEYIHVRARRGQATDSHSLAERVRREKISERMKFLQDLVPGCNKVTGKAVMLDEIINYVQSLQRQVEFLSMKLSTVSSPTSINLDAVASLNGTLNLMNRSNNSNNNSNNIQSQNPLQMLPNNMQASILHSATNNANSPSSNTTTNNNNVRHTPQLYSSNISLHLDQNQGTPHHDVIRQVADHPSTVNSSTGSHQQLRHHSHILQQQQLDTFSQQQQQQQHHVVEAAAHPPLNTATTHNIPAVTTISSVVVADRDSHDNNDVDDGNDHDEASGGGGGSNSNRISRSSSSSSSRRRRGNSSWEVMDELQSIVQMRFPAPLS